MTTYETDEALNADVTKTSVPVAPQKDLPPLPKCIGSKRYACAILGMLLLAILGAACEIPKHSGTNGCVM